MLFINLNSNPVLAPCWIKYFINYCARLSSLGIVQRPPIPVHGASLDGLGLVCLLLGKGGAVLPLLTVVRFTHRLLSHAELWPAMSEV